MTFDRRKSITGVERRIPNHRGKHSVIQGGGSIRAARQLGHLSLMAPTGNHVIESHSPCDCHLVDDRFHQTATMLHLICAGCRLAPDIDNRRHLFRFDFRFKSCINFARVDAARNVRKDRLEWNTAGTVFTRSYESLAGFQRFLRKFLSFEAEYIWMDCAKVLEILVGDP